MMHLGQFIGRQQAHDVVYDACAKALTENRSLYSVLSTMPEIASAVPDEKLRQMLDPANYTGQTSIFIDNVLGKLTNG
jgi:3-carboxy-cis,cis-muconate cycloisomerase